MDISTMLEVQVKEETDIKENVTPGNDQPSNATGTSTAPISQEENNYYKLIFGNDITIVRLRRVHCTACDKHIGSAPAQAHNMFEHPVLRTLLCANCRDFYGDGTFEQGDDATDMFCRWCANGGNLYCCSYCSNTFCYKCIKRNFTSLVRRKIEADEKWKCFVCNPSDLYSLRALCWALLQHVQTMTRIIKQDKKLTAQEIEEKMNLDETLCCPHRTKRKRRRRESNSEDDETYSPKVNGVPTNVKHKPVKKYRSLTHRTGGRYGMNAIQPTYKPPIPIRPRPNLGLLPSGQSLQADPLKSVSHEKSATKSESIVVPSPGVIKPNTTLSSRFDSNTLQQQSTLYHTSFMNTSGSTAYIQTPVTVSSATRIILPPQSQPQLTSYPFQQPSSYQSQQTSSYQSQQASPYQPQVNSYQPRQANSYQSQTSSYQPSLQSSPNTMVSIPNTLEQHRSLFLLPKPKESNITLTPNIIELDSDSDDEPRVVVQQNNMTTDEGSMDISSISNISSSKIVPVALTWENNDDEIMREEQPLREMRATVAKDVSFNEVMLPHTRELDRLLSDTKEKMYNLFDLNSAIENIEVKAQQKMEHFYCNMRDAVIQLVHINDRVVRQYTEWRRSRKTEASSSINKNALVSQENMNIPLDMICVNDSDTEFEYQAQVMKPSDLVKDSNIIKDLLFRKTNVVHRGVGDDRVQLSADKAIQVYDTVSIDYEKSISCSIFTKTNQDSKTDDNISNLPATSDKKFSKYEEQFLFYLQHIEDTDKILNVKTKKGTNAANSDDTSVQEVIQTNPSFISHLFQDIDLPVISTDQSKNCQENNLNDSINSITKDDKNDILDKNNKGTVNNSDVKTNMQLNNKLQQMDSQKIQANMMNRETVISYNEVNSSKNDNIINMEVVAFSGSEEDCTIIDD